MNEFFYFSWTFRSSCCWYLMRNHFIWGTWGFVIRVQVPLCSILLLKSLSKKNLYANLASKHLNTKILLLIAVGLLPYNGLMQSWCQKIYLNKRSYFSPEVSLSKFLVKCGFYPVNFQAKTSKTDASFF